MLNKIMGCLSRKEREKIGLVGKQVLTNVKTGKKSIVDFESENVGVLDEEGKRLIGFGVPRPIGKNFTDIYDEEGNVVAYREIIEREDD